MKYIREYQVFEASATAPALTKRQINWLDKCAAGRWKLNPQTGLVDVDGDFYCPNESLQDFKGVKFGKVSGTFRCSDNRLTSLVGAPQSVGGDFYCNHNQLTSLVGSPKTVKGRFNCPDNSLTSLVGAPLKIGWRFYCQDNSLTSLEGAPHSVGCLSYFDDNPVSRSTLRDIFELMQKGDSYKQALEKYWPDMGDEDRVLMYKQIPNLPPEDVRKYKALATYNNIKGYL